jgi:diketogulonate reductase-like aldo/keto reductase
LNKQLDAIIKETSVFPAVNQVERHPILQSLDLVAYCQEKGVHITAYSESIKGPLFTHKKKPLPDEKYYLK